MGRCLFSGMVYFLVGFALVCGRLQAQSPSPEQNNLQLPPLNDAPLILPPVHMSPNTISKTEPPKMDLAAPKIETPITKIEPMECPPKATTSLNDPLPFEAIWKNGLFFQTKNQEFIIHVGGIVHYDAAWYTASEAVQFFPGGVGQFNDGVNFRRGRLRVEGTMYKDYDFLLELEFANGFSPAGLTGPVSTNTVSLSPGPTDAWVTIKNIPFLGNVRIGSQKEPFSLEHLNSFRFLSFIERSYLFDASQNTAFNNGFNPGIMAFRTWMDDMIYSAIGVFKNESDLFGFGFGDGQYAVTSRITYLPIYMPDEEYFAHIGGAMSYRDPVDEQVRVRVRNNIRNAPFPLLNLIADTGDINAESQVLFNIESAASYGPFTFQAEYLTNLINGASVGRGPDLGTVRFHGYYVETLVFLTGEHRSWNPKTATFNRVTPKRNFGFTDGKSTGLGAIEFGLRYTYLDLVDKGIFGSRLNSLTLGLNWYWNANMRMQFNYDYLYRDESTNPAAKGNIHSFGTRLAFDF